MHAKIVSEISHSEEKNVVWVTSDAQKAPYPRCQIIKGTSYIYTIVKWCETVIVDTGRLVSFIYSLLASTSDEKLCGPIVDHLFNLQRKRI